MAYQTIFYGAPGTGKSYKAKELTSSVPDERVFRTTVHPEYSYSDFVGQLLPEADDLGNVKFVFKPGVFTEAITEAYRDLNKEVFLVMEEISRGNVAAIFGDIFQLLDRNHLGESEYFIINKNVARSIAVIKGDRVKLPSNLNIICTVNTNDQNVFPMDTAFKRRFEWEYISTKPAIDKSTGLVDNKLNNFKMGIIQKDKTVHEVNWLTFYTILNEFITNKTEGMGKKEDKQVGQFFISLSDKIVAKSNSQDQTEKDEARVEINRVIKNKLLFYLWQDVQGISLMAKGKKLFNDKVATFDYLFDNYEGECVFSDDFIDRLINPLQVYSYI